jgi:hypothetical protein
MKDGDWAATSILEAADPCQIIRRNGRTPYVYQTPLLRNRPHRGLVCWGRQSGKSSAVSALVLSQAFYRAPSLIVVSSFAERQSKELLLKAMELYRPFASEFPLVVDAKNEKGLANGSRVVALPGKADSARSLSGASLVVLDEAGWTTDELRIAIDPLLSTLDGDLIAMSTPPEEAGGWWWRTWTQNGRLGAEEAVETARDGWVRTLVPSDRCPSISPEFLASTRADFERMGRLREFEREYLCRFPDLGADGENPRPFTAEILDKIFGAGAPVDMPAARV